VRCFLSALGADAGAFRAATASELPLTAALTPAAPLTLASALAAAGGSTTAALTSAATPAAAEGSTQYLQRRKTVLGVEHNTPLFDEQNSNYR
jgi:hypothetical protein